MQQFTKEDAIAFWKDKIMRRDKSEAEKKNQFEKKLHEIKNFGCVIFTRMEKDSEVICRVVTNVKYPEKLIRENKHKYFNWYQFDQGGLEKNKYKLKVRVISEVYEYNVEVEAGSSNDAKRLAQEKAIVAARRAAMFAADILEIGSVDNDQERNA